MEITPGASIHKPAPHDWTLAIQQKIGRSISDIKWLAGDGSDRSYYRIHLKDQDPKNSGTMVLMQLADTDTTALKNQEYEWIEVESILHAHGILTPRPLHTIEELGLLIIEDYGNQTLESLFLNKDCTNDTIDQNIQPALDLMIQMQNIKRSNSSCWTRREFDYDRFMWELRFFKKHFLEGVLQYKLSRKQNDLFLSESDTLAKTLSQLPQVFTHRDFHSRNIMVTQEDQLFALIDFQDARLGPACYDFVSLVFDSYLPLSGEQRRGLFKRSCEYVVKNSDNPFTKNIKQHSHTMLIQRQLKAIGSFGYLKTVKKKPQYLSYVLPAVSTIEPLAEFSFLSHELPKIVKTHFQN